MSKSIVDKLKLMNYRQAAILNAPGGSDYFAGVGGYDTSLEDRQYDLIFAFVLDMASFKSLARQVIEHKSLMKNGYLYVAYPKMGNKVYATSIHRDEIFAGLGAGEDGYVGTSDLKFSRMVGLDEIFTVVGLKVEPRGKGQASAPASQRVDDYVDFIPNIEQDLADTPDLLTMYQSLTPGYRKDWARHVYSAKQEATREKRREEMKMILRAGFKTRELYRQSRGASES